MSKRRGNPSGGNVIRGTITFPAIHTTDANGGGSVQLSCIAPASTALNALQSVYRLYRFTRVKLTVLPYGGRLVVGYTPGQPISTPIAYSDVEARKVVMLNSITTVPATLLLSRSDLKTDHEWFVTEQAATEASAEFMGSIVFHTGAATTTVEYLVEIDYEFQGISDVVLIGYANSKKNNDGRSNGPSEAPKEGEKNKCCGVTLTCQCAGSVSK